MLRNIKVWRSLFQLLNKVGVEAYKTPLNEMGETYFKLLTMEMMVETIKSHCGDKWIVDFEDRYLDFGKIESN